MWLALLAIVLFALPLACRLRPRSLLSPPQGLVLVLSSLARQRCRRSRPARRPLSQVRVLVFWGYLPPRMLYFISVLTVLLDPLLLLNRSRLRWVYLTRPLRTCRRLQRAIHCRWCVAAHLALATPPAFNRGRSPCCLRRVYLIRPPLMRRRRSRQLRLQWMWRRRCRSPPLPWCLLNAEGATEPLLGGWDVSHRSLRRVLRLLRWRGGETGRGAKAKRMNFRSNRLRPPNRFQPPNRLQLLLNRPQPQHASLPSCRPQRAVVTPKQLPPSLTRLQGMR